MPFPHILFRENKKSEIPDWHLRKENNIFSLRWHYPNQVYGSKVTPSSQPVYKLPYVQFYDNILLLLSIARFILSVNKNSIDVHTLIYTDGNPQYEVSDFYLQHQMIKQRFAEFSPRFYKGSFLHPPC